MTKKWKHKWDLKITKKWTHKWGLKVTKKGTKTRTSKGCPKGSKNEAKMRPKMTLKCFVGTVANGPRATLTTSSWAVGLKAAFTGLLI